MKVVGREEVVGKRRTVGKVVGVGKEKVVGDERMLQVFSVWGWRCLSPSFRPGVWARLWGGVPVCRSGNQLLSAFATQHSERIDGES